MTTTRVRLRTLMIAVAVAALILTVETTTTAMDPMSQAVLVLACCLIAAVSVLLSELVPDPRPEPREPVTSITEDPALTLMRLSRYGSWHRSRRAGSQSPRSSRPAAVSRSLSSLATWALRLWTFAAFLWIVATAAANTFELSRMHETAEDVRVLRIIGVALLCSPALALTLAAAGRMAVVLRQDLAGR